MKKFRSLILLVLITSLFLTACKTQQIPDKKDDAEVEVDEGVTTGGDDESTDIVIVGAGLSGLMSGIELLRNHTDVNFIILEQMPSIGGSLSATGGAIFGTDSDWHKEQDKVSTVEDVVKYFEESSHTELNRDLIENVFEISGETFNWVEEISPLDPELKPASPYSDKLYTAWTEGRGLKFYEALDEYVSTLDMDLRLDSTVKDLMVEDGKVTGVKVKDGDKEYKIQAKNVILATGGFGKNDELMEKYAANYADGIRTVAPGANGDAIKFVEQFGTKIIGDGTMGTFYSTSGKTISSVPFMVNKNAQRFVNESDVLYRIQRVLADEADEEMFLITDSKFENIENIQADMENGVYKKYDSLEELAKDLELDESVLMDEIAKYNKAVENNESPGFGLPADMAHPIKEAPFYAGHALVRTFGTIPGVETNPDMQVLDENGDPITNLYAAGEATAGNAFSYQYPGAGIGISYACNSGRLAAINAAKAIK